MINVDWIAERCMRIKPGDQVLVITDTYARSKSIAEALGNAAIRMGADVVTAAMMPRTHAGHEPPECIVAGMKQVQKVFSITGTYNIDHTNARAEATRLGVEFYEAWSDLPEDYFSIEISSDDLRRMELRSKAVAEKLTHAKKARITTELGTDLTMSLNGRKGLYIHPRSGDSIGTVPDYAEGLISPVEGTTAGRAVIDGSVQGWNYVLRVPLTLTVKAGKVVDISGRNEDVERLKKTVSSDRNASNFVAELGIGTSHTVPRDLRGWIWDYAILGTVHLAVGRNNDIGGETWSCLHNDLHLTKATIDLEGFKLLEEGVLSV